MQSEVLGASERATVNATERLPPRFSFSKFQLRLMEDFISGAATPFRIYIKIGACLVVKLQNSQPSFYGYLWVNPEQT